MQTVEAVESPAAVPPESARRRASMRQLWVLMATVFVDMIGFTIVLPLLPFYATRLGAKPSMVGVLISAFALAQLATSPYWGRLSDRYGRRPMILAGLLLSAVAYVIFGLAHSLWLLLFSRLVQGIGSGTAGVVQAYVSDSIAPEERAKALGWVTAAISAGVMIGPLLGSLATYLGPTGPGYVAAALCLVNVLSAWRWLPESKRQEHGAASSSQGRRDRSILAAIGHVLSEPATPVNSLIWIYAVGMMAFMAMNGVLALYLGKVYGVTERSIGWFYAYVGSISLVMRAFLLGPAVRRFGEVGAMRLGLLALAVGMFGVPLPGGLGVSQPVRLACLALVVLLVPVGTALLFPSSTALVSRRSALGETGQVMGVQQAFGGIARLLGPLWATAVFQLDVRFPFWLAALFLVGANFLAARLRRDERPRDESPEVAARAEVQAAEKV
ncbi:MAG: MFS transporter [Acidobacteriota bacterium]|nr:MFS transporter [Acidobacteriota bacterium]